MTKNYPSYLTWEQWELIPQLLPEAKPGSRPRTTTCMYPVENAI
ncbi:Mobile element protein [Richelia intracellularis]|nr:Mobile element protein [Richelia intracellularis]